MADRVMPMTPRRAFRLYARLGLHRRNDRDVSYFQHMFGSLRLDGETQRAMLAVRDTLRALRASGDEESTQVIIAVYMAERGRTPAKSETSRRVLAFAQRHYCDERTVYRRLHKACRLYRALMAEDSGRDF